MGIRPSKENTKEIRECDGYHRKNSAVHEKLYQGESSLHVWARAIRESEVILHAYSIAYHGCTSMRQSVILIRIVMHVDAHEKIEEIAPEQVALYREMIAAGVASGRKKSRTNPQMDGFVFTYTRGVAVFDVAQTLARIDAAADFLKTLIGEKRTVLVLGSQPAACALVQRFAEAHGFSYITTRWLGGMLTNFKTLSQRIDYFKKLKADKVSGELDKYTKKERVMFDRLINNMAYLFSGVQEMTELPYALFVVDAQAHDTAAREAKRLGIPVIAIMNNDNDPRGIAYPIPANDNTRSSLGWIFERIEQKLKA